jgi:hypothetical protein
MSVILKKPRPLAEMRSTAGREEAGTLVASPEHNTDGA